MVMMTLYTRQQKRHKYKEQTFGLWEKVRVGCFERIKYCPFKVFSLYLNIIKHQLVNIINIKLSR